MMGMSMIRKMSNRELIIENQNQVDALATIFKALSNPNRLRIFLELTHCSADSSFCTSVGIDEMVNCQQQFAKKLGLAPSTISHHFKELRQAGLLKMRKEGKNMIVEVDTQLIDLLKKTI
jgi:ArsR family transcriptional regulator, arsenate/arsenite/antimonite-responsive transcriptional repressor